MKQRAMQLPFKSNLHPMIHVFKNSSGHITRQYLCYGRGRTIQGKSDHRYDPEKCGWQQPLAFMYIGPILCCRMCHRHIYSEENFNRCPQCHRTLNANSTKGGAAIHTPVSRGRVPPQGRLVQTYAEGRS